MSSTPVIHNKAGSSMFIADDKVAVEVLSSKSMAKGSPSAGVRQHENIPDLLTADGEEYDHRLASFGSAVQALDVSNQEITGPLLLALSAAAHSGTPFDAAEFSTHLALDVLCKAAFGYELKAMSGSAEGHALWGHMQSLLATHTSGGGFVSVGAAGAASTTGATHTSAAGPTACLMGRIAWDAFLVKMLNIVKSTDTSLSSTAPPFCRNLLHWGNALPFPATARFDDHISTIRDHYMTAEIYQVLMHGHLALASQLMWLFVSLHKHVRARGVLELVLGAQFLHGTQTFPEYAECWIKEVLRKYPSVGNSTTRTVVDGSCELAGLPVPKGTTLRVNIFALQNSSKIWQRPGVFLPERFMHGKIKQQFGVQQDPPTSCPFYRSPVTEHNGGDGSVYSGCGRSDKQLSFLPFSAGARTCLGKNLTLKVLRRVLFHVMSAFRLDSIADNHDLFALSSSPSEGKEEALLATDRQEEQDLGKSVHGVILPMHRVNTILRVTKADAEPGSTSPGGTDDTPIGDYQ